jgi:hypothetical protein
VRIAVPERAFVPVASYSPNFIVHELYGKRHLVKRTWKISRSSFLGPTRWSSALA